MVRFVKELHKALMALFINQSTYAVKAQFIWKQGKPHE
jgi:hypothetical protein